MSNVKIVNRAPGRDVETLLTQGMPNIDEGQGDLIGVVVTACNQAAFIGAAIESVQRQSHRRLRCVVVDDGSTDETASVAASAIAYDTRFQLLRQENRGCSQARQAGADALGPVDYLLWLDGDDCLMPDALELLAAHLAEAHDAPAVCGLALPIDGGGRSLPRTGRFGFYHRWLPARIELSEYPHTWWLMTPGTTLWRRGAFLAACPDGYPPGVWKDGEDLRCEDVQVACMVTRSCGPIAGLATPTLLKREGVGWCAADAERLQRAVAAYREWVNAFIGSSDGGDGQGKGNA